MDTIFLFRLRALVVLQVALAILMPGLVRAADDALSAELRRRLEPVAATAAVQTAAPTPLQRVYAERHFSPLWQSPARREGLLAALSALDQDGLDPAEYGVEHLRQPIADTPTARAEQELHATESCLQALTHLQRGRLDPARFGHLWRAAALAAPELPSPAQALAELTNDDVAALFERFRPQTPLYQGLRAALARAVHETDAGEWPQLSPGPTLKPGMQSPRVSELRARLIFSAYLAPDAAESPLMDDALVEAVRAFQRDHGLEADGAVGRATLAELNLTRHDRLNQLRINLERARWIAAEQRSHQVLVDVAGYRLVYQRDGVPVWSGRTQVGMPTRQTPELLSRITHITVNPTWTVPPTILKKDIVPKASTDPDYLASRNIRVLDRDGVEVDPATVDWSHTGGLTFRQDFGDGSALGKVAIRFANPHAIYLHDTPNQRQFKRTERAFSSGCVRVENALELVRLLMDGEGSPHHARFDSALASGRTGNLNLPRPVPILVAYLTAGPDESGRITFRPDIYQRDRPLLQALETIQHRENKEI